MLHSGGTGGKSKTWNTTKIHAEIFRFVTSVEAHKDGHGN